MLLSASYVVLWFTQHVWDYAVEVQPPSLYPSSSDVAVVGCVVQAFLVLISMTFQLAQNGA